VLVGLARPSNKREEVVISNINFLMVLSQESELKWCYFYDFNVNLIFAAGNWSRENKKILLGQKFWKHWNNPVTMNQFMVLKMLRKV
jgi:hypothetical protein